MKTRFTGRTVLTLVVVCPALLHSQDPSNKEICCRAVDQHAVEAPIWRIATDLFSPAFAGSGDWKAPTFTTPAKQFMLMLRVTDIHKKPAPGLQLKVENGPVSVSTDNGGVARIQVPPGKKPGDLIKLHLVTS